MEEKSVIIKEISISGGVWAVAPIDEEPEISLLEWSVYEVEDGDRHFVGWNMERREGRVSSKIISFDQEKMVGITSSGRVYALIGKRGFNSDAEYTWNRWKKINLVQMVNDISNSLIK